MSVNVNNIRNNLQRLYRSFLDAKMSPQEMNKGFKKAGYRNIRIAVAGYRENNKYSGWQLSGLRARNGVGRPPQHFAKSISCQKQAAQMNAMHEKIYGKAVETT